MDLFTVKEKLKNSNVFISLFEEKLKSLKILFMRKIDILKLDYKRSSNEYKIKYCVT